MDYSTTSFREVPTLVVKWDSAFVIENLPPWVYKNHPMPASMNECNAKLSSLQHTLSDMDLQIEVKRCEKRIAELTDESFDEIDFYERIRKIHKAKQSTLYVISALKYWKHLNTDTVFTESDDKFTTLVELLIEDPPNFVDQARDLLD
tara:strand:+ start:637 stop:1080 length:444 start_codon:yes stop_codon:yes gene_type:complete